MEIIDGISIAVVPKDVDENSSDHCPKVMPFTKKIFSKSCPPTKLILKTSLIAVSSGGVSKVSDIKTQLLLTTVSKFFKCVIS